MATVTFEQARASVLAEVRARRQTLPSETVRLLEAAGRVLAEVVAADRDQPAVARSVRDGFAVRSSDLPGTLRIIGEVRAGESFGGSVGALEAVEIMTGAPLPSGADSVAMIEHVSIAGSALSIERTLKHGENVNPRASEARSGEPLMMPGKRLGYADIALLATLGRSTVKVFERPRIAILATGDEVLKIDEHPLPHQIRNSNSYSLAAQVLRAGGTPHVLPIARDDYDATRHLIERGLVECHLLLLSGGVSAGKYDIVEKVLADLGAVFYFDRVLIQPGQPLVFGAAKGKFFFGLPGNPGSTMVTFEVFARSAVELLGGEEDPMLPLMWSRLAGDFRQKTGLTRFLPAHLGADGSEVAPMKWQGSGDVPALARANAFLVTEPERETWAAGDWIRVLMK